MVKPSARTIKFSALQIAYVAVCAATVTADGPGACILRAGAEDLHWVALHLAWIGAPIEVIDPPELLELIEALGDWASRARRSS